MRLRGWCILNRPQVVYLNRPVTVSKQGKRGCMKEDVNQFTKKRDKEDENSNRAGYLSGDTTGIGCIIWIIGAIAFFFIILTAPSSSSP